MEGANAMKKKTIAMILFLAIVGIDIFLIFLYKYNYYVRFLKPTGLLVPWFLTIVALYIVAWSYKINRYVMITVSVIFLVFSVVVIFLHLLLKHSYHDIQSPDGGATVMIEYRNATHGETSHFYTFYRSTSIPMVVQKQKGDSVSIMTRHTDGLEDELTVLGINDVEWIGDHKVIFHSPFKDEAIQVTF